MSTIVFAGAAQFAAIGYVAAGLALAGDRAAHVSAQRASSPLLRGARPVDDRGAAAASSADGHVLTDEAFALAIGHFRRIGRTDEEATGSARSHRRSSRGTWQRSPACTPGDRSRTRVLLGIDIIFPAAMIGLAAGLITGRRELVAAFAGAAIAVSWALFVSPALGVEPSTGVIVGGVVGPLVGLLIPASLAAERAPLGSSASAERFSMPGTRLDDDAEGLP